MLATLGGSVDSAAALIAEEQLNAWWLARKRGSSRAPQEAATDGGRAALRGEESQLRGAGQR